MEQQNTPKNSVDFTSLYVVEGLKFVLFDTLKDAIFFWIWWYTDGITRAAGYCRRMVVYVYRILPLTSMLIHITRPIRGDYSLLGRLFGTIFRFLFLLVAVVFNILAIIVFFFLVLLWIFLPPVSVGFLIIALGWVR